MVGLDTLDDENYGSFPLVRAPEGCVPLYVDRYYRYDEFRGVVIAFGVKAELGPDDPYWARRYYERFFVEIPLDEEAAEILINQLRKGIPGY